VRSYTWNEIYFDRNTRSRSPDKVHGTIRNRTGVNVFESIFGDIESFPTTPIQANQTARSNRTPGRNRTGRVVFRGPLEERVQLVRYAPDAVRASKRVRFKYFGGPDGVIVKTTTRNPETRRPFYTNAVLLTRNGNPIPGGNIITTTNGSAGST